MKRKSKNLIILLVMMSITTADIIVIDAIASRNGPNYWGDAYPGQGQTPNYFQNPQRREDYVYLGDPVPSDQWYDGSHYGTHDWIADAALRSLKSVVENPLGWRDWDWLLENFLVIKDDHLWNPTYGNNGKHSTVRSYTTFLFATQMPDMKPAEYPEVQKITIPDEGTVIENIQNFNNQMRLGLWVGQVHQHRFIFQEFKNENGYFEFKQHITLAATKVEVLSKQAIKCISNKIKDENGKEVSAMQPEASAGWLGAMSHYFGDLLNPAHVHDQIDYLYVKDRYHKWFENHLAALTMWNRGPDTSFFKYDFSLIGNQKIIPIPPRIATTEIAKKTIKFSFRIDGNHQYQFGNAFSGMYINDSVRFWNWKDDISFVGRDRSQHKAFYSKVERLLCWAVYYTACAMQYCYNEGKKENNEKDPNHNFFAENPLREIPPAERPVPNPDNERDSSGSQNPVNDNFNRFARNFRNIGENLTTWGLLGIVRVLDETLKIFFR